MKLIHHCSRAGDSSQGTVVLELEQCSILRWREAAGLGTCWWKTEVRSLFLWKSQPLEFTKIFIRIHTHTHASEAAKHSASSDPLISSPPPHSATTWPPPPTHPHNHNAQITSVRTPRPLLTPRMKGRNVIEGNSGNVSSMLRRCVVDDQEFLSRARRTRKPWSVVSG